MPACLSKDVSAEDDRGWVVKNKVSHGKSARETGGHGIGQADKILEGQPLRPGFRIDPRLAEQGGHLLPRQAVDHAGAEGVAQGFAPLAKGGVDDAAE